MPAWLAVLLALPWLSGGLPTSAQSSQYSLPLFRRSDHARRSQEDWFLDQAARIKARYGADSSDLDKRQAMSEPLSNLNADSQYFATISVGTPAKPFYIVVDSGSADLWIASPSCSGCPSGIQTYDPSASSSATALDTAFSVTYGSGTAHGSLYEDTVTMAGYTVNSQVLASVNVSTGSLLTSPVSGLMGFGWKSIAASRATPWWQNAGISEFGVALTRYQNVAGATTVEPGGQVTINGVNNSLISGSMNYVDLVSESFWMIALDNVEVDGKVIANTSSQIAIDTGTTLIGGPASVVASIYAAIPGAKAQTGTYAGYYAFPCSTNMSVSLTMGGVAYQIAPQDFNLGTYGTSQTQCLGAIFAVASSAGQPSWIAGDSLIRTYYTSFRANPPAVGFAKLSQTGQDLAEAGLEASLTTSGTHTVASAVALKAAARPTASAPSWLLIALLGLLLPLVRR